MGVLATDLCHSKIIVEVDLDNYKHSELYKDIWSKTKILFNSKPEAWSVDKIVQLS